MDALRAANAGLTAAGDRFAESAARITIGSSDLTAELTEQVSAKVTFEASVSLLKTSAEMSKRLLDIMV